MAVKDAYIHQLEYACASTSQHGAERFKQPKLARQKFRKAVIHYLNSQRPDSSETQVFCIIIGKWIGCYDMRCAHIVPISLDVEQLPYMFGTEDAAPEESENGLMLYRPIEEAFDNGEIAIVPDGSIDATPTEWKVALLQTSLHNKNLLQESAHTYYNNLAGYIYMTKR
ncbi:MAG: hypothetical protein Q9171_003736 [Xanthocarpia ochracea]